MVFFPAWMSCHFSPWGKGLTNLPDTLPSGSILILDDSNPPTNHDTDTIKHQLEEACFRLKPDCILLDFQHPNNPRAPEIIKAIISCLPCSVGVSQLYAPGLSCPVFLNCPAPSVSLETSIKAYHGRELWLELAPEQQKLTLTKDGCHITPELLSPRNEPCFYDRETASCYHWTLSETSAVFYVQRDLSCLQKLLTQAEKLGITRAVGLYQQLGADFYHKKAPTG